MEKMGIGEPTNEDLVDQMHHILEDFALFCTEMRARWAAATAKDEQES